MIYGSIVIESQNFCIPNFRGTQPRDMICDISNARTSKWWQAPTHSLHFNFKYHLVYDSVLMLNYLRTCDITKPITVDDLLLCDVISSYVPDLVIRTIKANRLEEYFISTNPDAVTENTIHRPGSDMYSFPAYRKTFHFLVRFLATVPGRSSSRFGKYIGDNNCGIESILQDRIAEYNDNIYRKEAVLLLADTVKHQRMQELINNTAMEQEDFVELGKLSMGQFTTKQLPIQSVTFIDHAIRARPENKKVVPAPNASDALETLKQG